MNRVRATHFRSLLTALALLCLFPFTASAQGTGLEGRWQFNQDRSDVTDRQVEDALRAMGQKVERRLFDRRRDRYRGGPPEQELYDRISYDETLAITARSDSLLFTYDGNWQRPVYTDNRARSVSLSNLGAVEDFSFGHWEGERFLVEGRPRDGGFSNETYTLSADGLSLTVDMYIKPGSFTEPVEITRVYDRVQAP